MQIEITNSYGVLSVRSPYHAGFVAGARNLSGRFSAGAWSFDPRVEADVRKLCQRCYGTDGTTPADVVTLRVAFGDDEFSVLAMPIEVGGRTIARAFGRDSGAKTGEGVIVDAGGFSSGGSVKNWRTVARAGTVVRILDMPRATAEELCATEHEYYRCEIVADTAPPAIDRDALVAERARLQARLAEIAAVLGE